MISNAHRLLMQSKPQVPITKTYILDQYPNAWGFSVNRKLSSTATKAFQIQRSSDSASLDIGFVGDLVDINSAISFVGSNTGTIAKFYEQSGTGYDLTPQIFTSAPYLIVAGVPQTSNGKAAISQPSSLGSLVGLRYSGSLQSTPISQGSSFAAFAIAEQDAFGVAYSGLISLANFPAGHNDVSSDGAALIACNTGIGQLLTYTNGYSVNASISTSSQQLIAAILDGSHQSLYVNGRASQIGSYSANLNVCDISLGMRLALNTPWLGKYQEALYFPNNYSLNSSQILAIQTNQNQFYGAY